MRELEVTAVLQQGQARLKRVVLTCERESLITKIMREMLNS